MHRLALRALPERPPTGLDVPTEVWDHLRSQYSGVFDERAARRHVRDHLGDAVADEQIRLVERRCPGAQRIIDVGCGYGTFVSRAAALGFAAVGIDLEPIELRHARRHGAAVIRGDGARLPLAEASADVVTMWNVLEHVADRVDALQAAHHVLRPGGSLFVEAPNYAAFRREAHYHVPWGPGVSRFAVPWLRLIGRDPRFWRDSIRPCSVRQVRRELRACGFAISHTRIEKLRDPSAIRRPLVRRLVLAVERMHLTPVFAVLLAMDARNPIQGSIRLHAIKT